MQILAIESGPLSTIGYLIYDEESKLGAVVDVPLDSYSQYMEIIHKHGIKLMAILLTHSHWDHTGEAALLHRETQAAVYIHKEDEYRLLNQMEHTLVLLPFEIESLKADKYLKHLDKINIGKIELEVLHTPGHTEGGVCFVCHSEKLIFSGDTLFNRSVGRTDFPGGNWELLKQSISEQILSLPDDYKVYCGHGLTTTISDEKKHNPYIFEILTS